MQFFIFAAVAALIALVDQVTKWLVVDGIQLYEHVDAIPGLFHLTHYHNTGAAWSSFEGMRWLFVGLFVLLTVALVYEYFRKRMGFTTFERWCIAALYGGALGNAIDRARLGYVVDMIKVDFMDFPVFNVADCFITCGCILLLVHLFFFNKPFWKEGKK
jgi:signal peptidase II